MAGHGPAGGWRNTEPDKDMAMMMPVRRNMKFSLPADAALTTWHPSGYHVSMFVNTLSLLFPIGERFFIDAVRAHRAQVTDAGLQEAISAFIGQEAMHGREHQELNDLLKAQGYPVREIEDFTYRLLKRVEKGRFGSAGFRKAAPLNSTIALEHFTAILADAALRHPDVLDGAQPEVRAMLRWHAMEETEHKAVAFDVWKAVHAGSPREYRYRVLGQVAATVTLFGVLAWAYPKMLRAKRQRRDHLRGGLQLANFLFGRPGIFRRVLPDYLDYFRQDFHPWDHDNREFLVEMGELEADHLLEAPPPRVRTSAEAAAVAAAH